MRKWGRSSRQTSLKMYWPAGNLSPCPGNGTQHDSEGTGCQNGEQAEVQYTLHSIIAHPHHCIQVVLKRSNAEHRYVAKLFAHYLYSRCHVWLHSGTKWAKDEKALSAPVCVIIFFIYVLHIRWDFNIIHVNRIAVMNRTVQTNLQTTKEVFKITFIFSALSSTFSFTLKSWMATYSQVDLVVLL